jgi:hypothetical protein
LLLIPSSFSIVFVVFFYFIAMMLIPLFFSAFFCLSLASCGAIAKYYCSVQIGAATKQQKQQKVVVFLR